MSELKAYTFSNMEGRGLAEYYLKSEADKVIAELKHHLHPGHDDEVARLKERIAELEKENAELKEAQRWRKFSEEKPKEKQWILVYYGYENNGCRIDLRRWDNGCKYDVEFQEIYTHWMPLPSAPKEEK